VHKSSAKTIGIVGGGQLGRMLTQAAIPLGFKVLVIDPNVPSPAAQVGAEEITAEFTEAEAIKKLAKKADYITIESEHIDAKTLDEISKLGVPINPSPKTVQTLQDKLLQKNFLKEKGIAVATFAEIKNSEDAKKTLKKFGGQMVLKTRHGGFDGRGNALVKNAEELKKALIQFDGKLLYAEKVVAFKKELAVIIARDMKGNIKIYPVAETIHERNICQQVIVPARVSASATKKALLLAKKVARYLSGAGVFAIEMFLTNDGKVLVNEIAPRVHNSGHFTIDACATSQFEQHIRAIAGLPLGETTLLTPAAVMVNILGERSGEVDLRGLDKALELPHTSVHLYGKSPTKIDRKMGHITALGDSAEEAIKLALLARHNLSV
jgi:5-(carboxyamino)imidazole ribonucleotide synthase